MFRIAFLATPKNVLVFLSSNFIFYTHKHTHSLNTHIYTRKVKLFGVISDSSSNFAYLRLTSRKKTFFNVFIDNRFACRNMVMLPEVVSHFFVIIFFHPRYIVPTHEAMWRRHLNEDLFGWWNHRNNQQKNINTVINIFSEMDQLHINKTLMFFNFLKESRYLCKT